MAACDDHPRPKLAIISAIPAKSTYRSLPVLVDDYLSKVTATPSDADLKALYEEGKKRYPNKMFPEPGFQRRYEANIEFVSGNLEAFIDAEKKKLTDEQILAAITNELLLVVTRFQTNRHDRIWSCRHRRCSHGKCSCSSLRSNCPHNLRTNSTDAAPKTAYRRIA